jgi:hypothetical protein
MSLTVEDLKPKNFKVIVRGVELDCKPLRLSHALTISKIGEVFQNAKSATPTEIKDAEKKMDNVIAELVPELKDFNLDMAAVMELMTQFMEHIQPTDVEFLNKNGVKVNEDPKVERAG